MSANASSIPDATALSPNSALSLDIETNGLDLGLGHDWQGLIEQAVKAALAETVFKSATPAEIYVELVSDEQSQSLNRDYRGKDYPTNVLSFPGTEPDDLDAAYKFADRGGPPVPLGDVIIAAEVVRREAAEQKKPIHHHFTHLIVHGVLHLLGYDHMEDNEAEAMEALERHILTGLDIPDPYRDTIDG